MSYFISHLRVDGVLVIVTKHHRPGHVLQYDDRLGPSHTIAGVEACAVGRIKESAREGPVSSHALLRLRLATNGSPAYGDCSGECHGDGAVATRTFAMRPTNTLQFEGCRRTIIAARTEA